MQAVRSARTNLNVSCDQVFAIAKVNARGDISKMHISAYLAHPEIENQTPNSQKKSGVYIKGVKIAAKLIIL